jgi:SAM-dependent methyltransferase
MSVSPQRDRVGAIELRRPPRQPAPVSRRGVSAQHDTVTIGMTAGKDAAAGSDVERLAAQMRRDWDARAALDPWHYVLFRPEGNWREDGSDELDRLQASLGFEIGASDRVVEIGCGVGRLTWTLAGKSREVWALDVSNEMLELARENLAELQNVHFIQGDGTTLRGIDSGAMDLVLSALTLTHLPRCSLVIGYLAEAARVLRPGGRLAVQVNTESAVRFGARRVTHQTLSMLKIRRGRRGLERGRTWSGSRIGLPAVRRALEANGLRLSTVHGAGSLACWIHAVREEE